MTVRTARRRWREGKVRPIPGNSPPAQPVSWGVCPLRRVCDDPFSATPLLQLPTTSEDPRNAFGEACGIYRSDGMVKTIPQPRPPSCPASRWSAPRLRGGPHQELMMRYLSRFLSFTVLLQNARALGMRLFRHGGIYRSDVSSHLINLVPGSRFTVGSGPGYRTRRKNTPCPSSAMSSGRLFLDRVARQHCPSPLHRHGQTTTPPHPARLKPDISTLRRIGHFYFALTCHVRDSALPIRPPHSGQI